MYTSNAESQQKGQQKVPILKKTTGLCPPRSVAMLTVDILGLEVGLFTAVEVAEPARGPHRLNIVLILAIAITHRLNIVHTNISNSHHTLCY